MRGSFAPRSGFVLIKSPNARHQAARRRAFTAAAVLALALASGAIGALSRPHSEAPALGKPQTGPFSYFPSE
jgi:hypothetical protein